MSISNLLIPNNYDLFSNSLTTNTLTTNSLVSNGQMIIKGDSTVPSQLIIEGKTDTNKQLVIGYNTTTNEASIQSVRVGLLNTPLNLQQYGSYVIFGQDGVKYTNIIVSGYVPTPLSYYEQFVLTTIVSGPFIGVLTQISMTRIGNMVILYFPGTSQLGNAASSPINFISPIPTRFLPANLGIGRISGACYVYNGSANIADSHLGVYDLDLGNGLFTIYNTLGTDSHKINFAVASPGIVRCDAFGFSYIV